MDQGSESNAVSGNHQRREGGSREWQWTTGLLCRAEFFSETSQSWYYVLLEALTTPGWNASRGFSDTTPSASVTSPTALSRTLFLHTNLKWCSLFILSGQPHLHLCLLSLTQGRLPSLHLLPYLPLCPELYFKPHCLMDFICFMFHSHCKCTCVKTAFTPSLLHTYIAHFGDTVGSVPDHSSKVSVLVDGLTSNV